MLLSLKTLMFLLPVMAAGYAIFYTCLRPAAQREVGFKPLIVFAVLGAIGFVAPNLWVVHAVFLLIAPVMARSREEVAQILLVGVMATPEFAQRLVIGDLQLIDYRVQLSLFLGALAAFYMSSGRRIHPPRSADFVMLLFISMTFFIAVRGTSTTNILRHTLGVVIGLGVPYYVITRSMQSVDSIRRTLLWLAGAGVTLSTIVMFEALRSWALYGGVESRFGIISTHFFAKIRLGWLRAYGPYLEATVLGYVLVIVFVAVLASRRAFVSKLHHVALLAITVGGLLAPQSRGAWLGAGVAAVCATLYGSRAKASTFAVAAAFLGAMAILVTGWGGGGGELQGTVDYREDLLRRGIEEFWKSPIIGASYDVVLPAMQDLRQGEGIVDFVNAYLYYALLSGSIGLGVFVFCLLFTAIRLWRDRRVYPVGTAARDAGAFCFAAVLSSAAMISVSSLANLSTLLLVFGWGMAGMLPWLASRQKKDRPQAKPRPATAHLAVPRPVAEQPHP